MIDLTKKPEKALAVSVIKKGSSKKIAMEHLEELSFLAQTSGAEVVDIVYQELEHPNRSTMLGKGKVEGVNEIIMDEGIDIVIFDDDLTPMQVRNLEKEFNIKVMDRSGIILDIFATRAKTKAAKTQVELAQLQYLLPRLTRMWTHLSKQHGGIGTKGPGETQIETDRRMIRTRIEHLKKTLTQIAKQSAQKRKNHSGMPRFGLVGYTNAGKSTLMRSLTGDEKTYVEDKLFATLDTTSRKFELPLGQEAILSDTVGFIRKLPANLIASFHSTLAEAREADFLLHVVDVNHDFFRDHIDVVEKTLETLQIDQKNTILVFNKIDQIEDTDEFELIKEDFPNSIFISAAKGTNIDQLLNLLQKKYDELSNDFTIMIPYSNSEKLSDLYNLGEVVNRKDTDDGFEILVRVQDEKKGLFENKFAEFVSSS